MTDTLFLLAVGGFVGYLFGRSQGDQAWTATEDDAADSARARSRLLEAAGKDPYLGMAKQLIAWGVCVSPERYIELAALHDATESQLSYAEATIMEGSRAHLKVVSDVESGGRELKAVRDRIDAEVQEAAEKLTRRLEEKKRSRTPAVKVPVCSLDCISCQDQVARTPGGVPIVITG